METIEFRVEPAESFFERGKKLAALADAGKRIPPSRIVAFEDAEDLLSLLTPKRISLLKSVKETPSSISELAKRLNRDRSAVTRDVHLLEKFEVVQVTERPLPGHGRQKWVESVAQDIQLTAKL